MPCLLHLSFIASWVLSTQDVDLVLCTSAPFVCWVFYWHLVQFVSLCSLKQKIVFCQDCGSKTQNCIALFIRTAYTFIRSLFNWLSLCSRMSRCVSEYSEQQSSGIMRERGRERALSDCGSNPQAICCSASLLHWLHLIKCSIQRKAEMRHCLQQQ